MAPSPLCTYKARFQANTVTCLICKSMLKHFRQQIVLPHFFIITLSTLKNEVANFQNLSQYRPEAVFKK